MIWEINNKDNSLATATAAGNKESYSYYLNGNRKSTTGGGKTTNYYYDGLGRLTTEVVGGGHQCITYSYDSSGNRIKKSVSGVENPTQTSYTYDKNNRLTKEETHDNSDNYTINAYYYDKNGNQTYKNVESYIKPERLETRLQIKADGNGTSYAYDGLNRLKEVKNSATTASYTYNGDNLRQTKTVNGTTTRHVYNGQNVIYEEINGTAKAAYHRLGDRIISSRIYTDSRTIYYAYNGQGNISQLLYSNNTVAVDYTYDAFGYKSAANDDVYNPFRYNGEYYDEETGYTYLRNRYYDSDKGRFITEDKYWNTNNMIYGDNDIPDIMAITQSSNLYVYCQDNPINLIDPTGNYNRDAAVAYARQYGGAGYLSGDRNNSYYNYRTNCANFVSQCLFAGGIKMNSSWYSYRGSLVHISNLTNLTWNNSRYDWNVAEPWRRAKTQFEYFSNPDNGYIWSDVLTIKSKQMVKNAANNWGIQAGDLLYLAGKDGSNVHHAMIVTKVENGEIYYAGNTNERVDAKLSENMGNEQIKVIRIRNEAELGYKL